MKTLFVLRHSKAEQPTGQSDHDRRLTDRGKSDAKSLGTAMLDFENRPDAVLCSTAKRAKKTAKRVIEFANLNVEPKFLADLYLATAGKIEQLIQQHGQGERLLIVGHNPGFEQLLGHLRGEFASLPTTGLAQLTLEINSWSEFAVSNKGTLVRFWTP